MDELQELAVYAARYYIKGRSFVRNAILKPFDIIFQELEQRPDRAKLVRVATKDLIYEHLNRIAEAGRKPGRNKAEQVNQYVDLFFDKLLAQGYHGNINKLLNDKRVLQSAYLIYFRQQLAEQFAKKGQSAPEEDSEDAPEISEEADAAVVTE